MRPFAVDRDVWRVALVRGGDPSLVDRTGTERLAVTDPITMTVSIRDDLTPPLLDEVMVHEVSHAVAVSRGLLGALRASVPQPGWVPAEEWAAQMVGRYGLEAIELASESLGRPVCVRGFCHG